MGKKDGRRASTKVLVGAIARLIHALGERQRSGEVEGWEEDSLRCFLALQKELRKELAKTVLWRREQGWTDRELAEELGTTRQNVSKRWPGRYQHLGQAERFWRSRPDRSCGDDRVECDERGGDDSG